MTEKKKLKSLIGLIIPLKLKKEKWKKKKKENSPEPKNSNIEAEVYNNNRKCDWGGKREKNLNSLIQFHSAN